MESINIETDILANALKTVGTATPRSATMPILQCVRIDNVDGKLSLEATDLDAAIRITMDHAGPDHPIITPHERFTAWISRVRGEMVKVSATDRKVTLSSDGARSAFPVLGTKTWPEQTFSIQTGRSADLAQGPLVRAMTYAQVAICDESSRYQLNGASLESDGETCSMVSTDGHRMVVYSYPSDAKIGLLVPNRLIKVMRPLLQDTDDAVTIAHDDRLITAKFSRLCVSEIGSTKSYELSCRKINGVFPNWKAVLPSGPHQTAKLYAPRLMESLERSALLSDDSASLDLTFAGSELCVHAANDTCGESDEVVPLNSTVTKETKIRVNGDYLRGIAKHLECDTEIHLFDEVGSAMVMHADPHEGEHLTYVLMPMRA